MDLDQTRERIDYGLTRLFRWDFPWSPFAGFLGGVVLSLHFAVLTLGISSASEASLTNSVELAGSYLQVFAAITLAYALGKLEEEHFGRPPWWSRSVSILASFLVKAKETAIGIWRSVFGISKEVKIIGSMQGVGGNVEISIEETVEYSSLEDRVDALEKYFRKELSKVKSRQDTLEAEIEKVASKTEDVEEDLKEEIESVWSFGLHGEVVALLWLILGPLISVHPPLLVTPLSVFW